MSWTPISNTEPQYEENNVAASGFYIKFYASGTTTPISMATDSTGGTLIAKAQLDTQGYPINGSSAIFIPHIDQKYKIALFRNATDADNNTLANAAWVVDALFPVGDVTQSTYTAAGAGAINSDVETRLRKTFYSSDYSTIQEAVTAAAGNRLVIDAGFTATSTTTVPDNTDIISIAGQTITSSVTLTNGFEIFRSGNNCDFSRMTFSGNAIDEAGYCAIETTGADNILIEKCTVTGHGEAFLVQDSDNVRVIGNTITGTQRWSVMFAKTNNCRAEANRISGSIQSDGIKVNGNIYNDATDYDNNHLMIKDNIINGCARDGIDSASGCDTIHIEGNDCYGNTLNGIECKAQNTSVTAQRIFIKDNSCLANGAHGIRIDDISKSEIVSNHVDSNSQEGILAQNAIIKVKISENQVYNNTDNGIRLQGDVTIGTSSSVDITDNKCIDNGTGGEHGVSIGNYVDDILVKDNECYQTSSGKTASGVAIVATTTASNIRIIDNYCPQDKLANTSNAPISMGALAGDGVFTSGNVTHSSTVFTFDQDDTTPEVSGGNHIYQTNNTVATTITQLDQGSFEMGPFTIMANDANTTFQHGTGAQQMRLAGGVNFVPGSQYSSITFIARNNRFIEISRTVI